MGTGKAKILVIEDEPDILEVITYNLSREGFNVIGAMDGEQGVVLARKQAPDLILLDLMLPGLDGIEVCRRLRDDPLTRPIPVVMVTAKGEESDIVLGLGIGADDYVTKPFSPKELTARVRAVLRRGAPKEDAEAGERVVRGALLLDIVRHEASVAGEVLDLTPTEFRLLRVMAAHPGRVFTRDQLVSRAIGYQAVVLPRNIDVHVRSLRQKLGAQRDMIETLRGVGYRFRESA